MLYSKSKFPTPSPFRGLTALKKIITSAGAYEEDAPAEVIIFLSAVKPRN